ncbi:DUF6879 family protein [Nocardiopsis tropica]|uniref:DUF6879 domain-containing protein n=1 Tax=Nocardiopsis tropica TaxID=109330 RepID=A0ABU7KHX6_9ACTN|nr:DUF6879 family protein [Nocardiopsis umidischolae]MEE2048908.1 hypothetical protein [Nocardiopsis umidischolae]
MAMSDFMKTFDDFRHQVFRLETLDSYDSRSERVPLERFRAGLSQDPSWLCPWAERVRAIRARGALFRRVHVVDEPLSEYLVFEMTCAYPSNAQAGEEIGILSRTAAEKLGVPEEDYWLFDDDRTGVMVYGENGALVHVEVNADPEIVREHVRRREAALANAVPLQRYMAEAGLTPQV